MLFVGAKRAISGRSHAPLVLAIAASLGAGAAQAGVVSISNEFNFREVRVGDTSPVDDLVLGFNAVDSDTGVRPVGATAQVVNTVTNEVFDMRLGGGNEYFLRIPHTAARASGDFNVQFSGDGFSGTGLVSAFGTGPGTGAMPTVENLQATGSGSNRGLSWDIPGEIANQTGNDGNISRLRVRLDNANGSRVLDLRGLGVGNTQSLQETSFQFDPSLITQNGVYKAQLLTEGFNPFNRGAAVTSFVVDDIAGLGGTPIEVTDTIVSRSNRTANSVGWTPGDRLELTALVQNADGSPVAPGTTAGASLGGTATTLFQADEPDRRFEFSRSLAYQDGLSGPWTMTAFNGSESDSRESGVVDAPSAMPFVRNVAITANGLMPTLTWDLPDNSAGLFDRVQIGLFDDVTDFRLSVFGDDQNDLFENLDATAESFTFEDGQLEFGKQYVARVILSEADGAGDDRTSNRSISFFNFTPIAGESDEPVFLPTVDEGGNFDFDFDVVAGETYAIDPFVAVGYDFTIGAGDPTFATVSLPNVGNGIFDLFLFDDAGNPFDSGIDLIQGEIFEFSDLGTVGGVNYTNGADRFRILGIETAAMLDPNDVTAFVADVSFTSSGAFTGSMTPITEFVAEAPEPQTWLLMSAGLLLVVRRAHTRKTKQGLA